MVCRERRPHDTGSSWRSPSSLRQCLKDVRRSTGLGRTIPLSATGLHTTFDTNLTVGRFLTLDEVQYFKELTVWVAVSNSAAMDHSGPAADTLTILPGIRFRIATDTWFLYGVEIPLVARLGTTIMACTSGWSGDGEALPTTDLVSI